MQRGSPARLALITSFLMAVAIWAPPRAHAVYFSGPTYFGVGTAPQSVAVGDFNGDSDPDLAVANEFSNNLSVLLGSTGGTFTGPTNHTAGLAPLAVAVADFNGDLDPDLAVGNEASSDVSILLGGAGATFSAPTNLPAGNVQSIAVGDFNGDLDPDLVLANGSSNNVSILLGSTDGSFTAPTTISVSGKPLSVAVGEFNGDGDPDIATANELANRVSLLLGSTGDTFTGPTHVSVGTGPRAVAVGHFNGDSDHDLAVTNELDGTLSILLGGAGATFSVPTSLGVGILPGALAVGEFTGDSDNDLAVANQDSDSVSLLHGSTGGSFIGPDSFGAGDGPTSVVVGDFNGDSKQDVAMTNELVDNVSILLATNSSGYPRPQAAAQMRVPLAIAYQKCISPNLSHSGGLAGGSCNPAARLSSHLTVGTSDSNSLAPQSVGFVKLAVCPAGTTASGGCANPLGMTGPDVRLEASVTDVRCQAGASPCEGVAFSDYLGELRVSPVMRITDKHNSVTAGGTGDPATAADLSFPFTIPCAANPAGSGPLAIGATCSVVTSANAVSPGSVTNGKRGNWGTRAIEVTDGGADGDVDTAGNAVFARQGVFIP